MPDESFPVLEERQLQPPARKFFRGAFRDPAELPQQRPGTVLAFEVDGNYQTMARQHLTGTEPVVVRAVAVSVVSTRARTVSVDLKAPSANPADDFVIRIDFRCQVSRPETVATAGLHDVTGFLRTHLGQCRGLTAKCAGFTIDQISEARETAIAQIVAYCKVRPPHVDGMAIELDSVEVFTPDELRDFARTKRDTDWQQTIDELRRMGERKAVEFLKEMLITSDDARALAVSRGDIDSGDAAKQVAAREADQQRGALDLIKVLADSDRMDRVPLDIQHLFDSAVRSLTGQPTTPTNPDPINTVEPRPLTAGGRATNPDSDGRYIPDEDDLVND